MASPLVRGLPLLSIITVCYNARATLPITLVSLRRQSFQDYEYIVVDGASTDNTPRLLCEAGDLIDTLLSEPDKGIYDAMNKAVRLAKGEYVYFLNADDQFADDQVLSDVAQILRRFPQPDLLYGAAILDSASGRQRQRFAHLTPKNLPFANLCHQAVFARRRLFDQLGGFDTEYAIVADLDWLVRVFRSPALRRYVDRDICIYAAGGVSGRQVELLRAEKRRMQGRLGGPAQRCIGDLQYRFMRRVRKALGT